MSNKQLAYIYGRMLAQVCQKIGVKPTQSNKEVVKEILKRVVGIDTLAVMKDDTEFSHNKRLRFFIEQSAIFLASELAVVIDFPGEENVEEMEMKQFLKSIYG